MISANIFDIKTNFSRYVSSVETGAEPCIIIKRSGKPIAKIVPYDEKPARKIGIAKDKFPLLDSVEAFNDIDTDMFGGEGLL